MKRIYLSLIAKVSIVLFALATPLQTDAQTPQANATNTSSYNFWNAEMQAIAKPESRQGRVKFKDDLSTPFEQIMTTHKSAFGLSTDDSLALTKSWTSKNGTEHLKYQQYYKGIKIKGAEFVMHKNPSGNQFSNGNLKHITSFNTTPLFAIDSALDVAVNLINLNLDSTENPVHSNSIEHTKELIIFQDSIGNNYLTYEIKTFHNNFYLNALTTDVLYEEDNDDHFMVNQTTLLNYLNIDVYYSISSVHFDTLPGALGTTYIRNYRQFESLDTTRGNGIESFKGEIIYSPIIFVERVKFDTLINNYPPYYDGFYDHAYWATQMFYDFAYEKFNLNSIDNNGIKLNTYVSSSMNSSHFEISPSQDSVIALIGYTQKDFDVIGHEWGHGIDKFHTHLNRNNESGMLLEGFCDIVGHIFQNYLYNRYNTPQNDPDWLGNKGSIYHPPHRSMKRPRAYISSNVLGNHPDFYHGAGWGFNTLKGHQNSTVFSHWFYLFAQGTREFANGTKTNEVNKTYSFDGIGIDAAADVIMEVILGNHVTSIATFHEMRAATIDVVLNNGDTCYLSALLNAWDCVGVYGQSIFNNLLTDSTIISYYDTTIMSPSIFNNLTIKNGTTILKDSTFSVLSNSHITIKAGATLRIEDAEVLLGKNSSITIEPYGSLIINRSVLNYNTNGMICGDDSTNLNTWQGIKNQGNLHITKSKIKNAHIGVEVYASTQSNYIDHTDFIDCNKGVSFIAQPNGSSTIQYNLFKSSYIPPATTGGGISIGNISGGSVSNSQSLAFNSLAAQSSGSQWGGVTNQIGSINLGSKDQDNSYQSGIGIENAYGNIYGNAFIRLETGVYNANQIEQNYFGHCINGIVQNANPLPNSNLRIDRNVFNHTSKATTISTPIFSRIVANSYVNIPKANTPHQCYALKYSTNNYVQIDSNSFYGASYTNNHLKHNTAIIANAATQNNQIQHNTIKGVGMGIKISGHYHNINNNLLQNVRKGIYLTGSVVIENNQFLNIPPALDDNNPNTFDETYGVFAVGQKYRNIKNNQFMGANGSSTNTSNAISAGIVLEQSGSAPVYCTDNSFAKTDVGIQVEGINEQTKIFCNQFATDGIAHHIAGLKLTNDNTNGQTTNGKLRKQGTNCDVHTNPAGNEWLNPTGNTDIVIDLNNSNIRPYFLYVAHSIDQNSNTTTVPKHAYGTWNYTGTGSTANKMWACDIDPNNTSNGYQKQATSCDNYQTKSLLIGNTGSTASISDLLTEKAQLEGTLQNAEQNLTDPNYQPNLVAEIQAIHQKLSDIVILLAETYIANNQPTEAKLLLENENYVVAKEKLASIYYQEANYSQSRAVQDDVEYIINHTPSYYYKDIDEQQAQELNAIYNKEIEILQINVAESNRTLSQLHQWELYGLELIRQSGLPISSKAEELLELNQVSSAEHRVEPLDLNSQNFTASLAGVQYDFTLYPNPAINQSLALVPLPEESNGNATLKLINSYQATGGEIASYPLNIGDNSINLNLSNLSSGVYTVVLEVEGIVVASKQLVVIH